MSAPAVSGVIVTEPIIRARLRKAHDKQYRGGVLGLRARPVWDGGNFDYDGIPVTVVPCPSVLAIWEAIEARAADRWTVVLTNVDDDDLGDTVLAHLLDGRLITPDPWDALGGNFSAATIEPALYRSINDRAIANGLLAVLPSDGYTPAPGGVLTLDHVMAAVARDVLGIVKNRDVEIDALAVLEWSCSRHAADGLVGLHADGGTELADAFGSWLAVRSGKLAPAVTALLAGGRITDLAPLGVVAGLFDGAPDSVALGMFLGHYGLTGLSPADIAAWHSEVRGLVNVLGEPQSVLEAASDIVNQLGIGAAAASSLLLPQGLDARLADLAGAVGDALAAVPEDVTGPLIAASALQTIERRWVDTQTHSLAATSPTCTAFTGAMRLVRWLAQPLPPITSLADAVTDYVHNTSWVDTALVTARRGSEKPVPAEALRTIIDTTVIRRARIDRVFAGALADSPIPAVPTIETVLAKQVVPLAKSVPTLLIVADGLSLAAANELVSAVQAAGWTEVTRTAGSPRGSALAVLPTLTQRSRCSLLCGELREGGEANERAGFMALIREAGLQPTGGVPDPIFHKKALDAVPVGLSLATAVNNAIADTANQRLVAVVLNYVDDTLHHTDPGGTDWNLTTITHLRSLLYAARNAARAVVITSDHGHLIDYNTGAKVERANTYGQRAHGDFARVDPDREVVVEGPRVLTDNHKVVLAVDETIRYGARNAGYHGGGSPAEAIVPVVMLAAGRLPSGLHPVVGGEPSWWEAGIIAQDVPVLRTTKRTQQQTSLFDDEPDTASSTLPEKVVRTAVFKAQYKLAGRVVLLDEQIMGLLAALLAAGGNEITVAQAAVALKVATASVNGALMQTKRVLDVEGYEVLRVDRGVVRLDVAALTEQFGVTP